MIFLELFWGFLRVGFFAFGGAYSSLPLIRDVVFSNGWLTDEMLLKMIAVSESTPGPIMVNLATYVGGTQAGLPGAIVATTAVVIPAFVIIILVAAFMQSFMKNACIQAILQGVRPCISGVLLAVGIYTVLGRCLPLKEFAAIDVKDLLMTVLLLTLLYVAEVHLRRKVSPTMLIMISACLGSILYGI